MTQSQQILAHLKRGQPLTPLTALKRYGCLRLAARVYDLKEQGYKVKSKLHTDSTGKTYAVYWI